MSKLLTTKEFIEKSVSIHGNTYDYSLVDYKGALLKITKEYNKDHFEKWLLNNKV